MERAKWKKWWAIPLALFLMCLVQYAIRHGILKGLAALLPEVDEWDIMQQMRNWGFLLTLLLMPLTGLILRRFFDRAQLLRSALVASVWLGATQWLWNTLHHSFLEMLSLLFLPLLAVEPIQRAVWHWMGEPYPTTRALDVFFILLAAILPLLFIPFGKKKL